MIVNDIFLPKCYLKHFRKEKKNYNIYVNILKNIELIHVLIPLKNNGFPEPSLQELVP